MSKAITNMRLLRAIVTWGHLGIIGLLWASYHFFQFPDRPILVLLTGFLLVFAVLEWLLISVLLARQQQALKDNPSVIEQNQS